MPGISEIISALKAFRFIYSNERDLQDGVEKALKLKGISFIRERNLGDLGTVDFCVGTVGIEIKTKGGPSSVARQLARYMGSPLLSELVLFTGRSRLGRLPTRLSGKPLHVVTLWKTFL